MTKYFRGWRTLNELRINPPKNKRTQAIVQGVIIIGLLFLIYFASGVKQII